MAQNAASDLRARLDARLAARDRAGAVSLALGAVRSGVIGIADLYTGVLGPLLTDTGAAWQTGATAVWEEHYASAIVRTIVEALYLDVVATAEKVTPAGKHVLLACPPQEEHDLGLRMLSDRFLLAGWDVTFLGMDTPIAEIVAAARAVGAQLVVLSASTHFHRVQLRGFVDHLKGELPGVQIGVGGPAFALDRSWPADELLDPRALGLPGAAPAEG